MARVTLSNTSNQYLYIPSLHIELDPGQTHTFDRYLPEVELQQELMELWSAGMISFDDVVIEPWESTWRDWMQLRGDGAYATASASRYIHEPTVTPTDAQAQVGQGPTPIVLGTVVGLNFDTTTDKAYRYMKIQNTFYGDGSGTHASFHVHWTKSTDANEAGKTIQWRLSYTVFNGTSMGIKNVTPRVLNFYDTYDDSGTTTRIAYRTASVAAPDLVAGYYIGLQIEYVPAGTTMVSTPVLLSLDMLSRHYINQGTAV